MAAILALGGIIWRTRPQPEPLSKVVRELQDELTRRDKAAESELARRDAVHQSEKLAQDECIRALTSRVTELETRLATVTQLERDKSQLMAGVALLSNQIIAARMTPIWELPQEMAPTIKKPGTGPLGLAST